MASSIAPAAVAPIAASAVLPAQPSNPPTLLAAAQQAIAASAPVPSGTTQLPSTLTLALITAKVQTTICEWADPTKRAADAQLSIKEMRNRWEQAEGRALKWAAFITVAALVCLACTGILFSGVLFVTQNMLMTAILVSASAAGASTLSTISYGLYSWFLRNRFMGPSSRYDQAAKKSFSTQFGEGGRSKLLLDFWNGMGDPVTRQAYEIWLTQTLSNFIYAAPQTYRTLKCCGKLKTKPHPLDWIKLPKDYYLFQCFNDMKVRAGESIFDYEERKAEAASSIKDRVQLYGLFLNQVQPVLPPAPSPVAPLPVVPTPVAPAAQPSSSGLPPPPPPPATPQSPLPSPVQSPSEGEYESGDDDDDVITSPSSQGSVTAPQNSSPMDETLNFGSDSEDEGYPNLGE